MTSQLLTQTKACPKLLVREMRSDLVTGLKL